jgi:C-terminal processing protease CtpA/Prc
VKAPSTILTLLAFAPALLTAQTPADFQHDFEFAVAEIASTYAYLDERATRWDDVPALYAADLREVTTRAQFITLLERVLEDLYDPHAHLNVNLESSPRLVPSGADLWAEWRDGRAVITQVRSGSPADLAGITPGTAVVAINGRPTLEVVQARLGRAVPDSVQAARDWALRAELAGRHDAPRRLELEAHGDTRTHDAIRTPGATRTLELPPVDAPGEGAPPLEASEIRLGIGYIRLNDSLGSGATVAAFDAALEELRHTRGLVLDLRETPSGGNSSVARGILGRFVQGELPYQMHVLPAEERATGVRRSWLELVSPRGPFVYAQPVAVVVGRWTGSMGEGLAIGFDATGAGTVVGTGMAGLAGATTRITLPRTGIGINLPAERLNHVDGTPREAFRPGVLVGVGQAAPPEDPFMAAALRVLGGG